MLIPLAAGFKSVPGSQISNRQPIPNWLLFISLMQFTYILQSESTGRYYIGSTDNLDRRVAEHNDPGYKGSKTTKRFKGPWKLVYAESSQARAEAMLKWFNVDGHLAKSKIKESEVPNERKRKQNKVHKGIQS